MGTSLSTALCIPGAVHSKIASCDILEGGKIVSGNFLTTETNIHHYVRDAASLKLTELSANAITQQQTQAAAEPFLTSITLSNSIQEFRDFVQNSFGGTDGISSVTVFLATLIIIASAISQAAASIGRTQPDGFNSATKNQNIPNLPLAQLAFMRFLPFYIKFILCIAIDVIGDGSFLIPGLGEVTDVVWGPVAAILLQSMYGSNILSLITLVKELLPFTDWIPTATVTFFFQLFFGTTPLGIILGFAPSFFPDAGKDKNQDVDYHHNNDEEVNPEGKQNSPPKKGGGGKS